MKKSLVFFIAILFMASCATVHNNGKGKISAQQKATQIEDSINAGTIQVEFNYVNPMSMPPHYLTTTYTLRLKGDTIQSDLPYFGRAYRSNYANNDRSPLSFNGKIYDINVFKGKKNDYNIVLKTRNDTEQLTYTLDVYLNGQAYLTVNSSDRETISFNGEVVDNTNY